MLNHHLMMKRMHAMGAHGVLFPLPQTKYELVVFTRQLRLDAKALKGCTGKPGVAGAKLSRRASGALLTMKSGSSKCFLPTQMIQTNPT